MGAKGPDPTQAQAEAPAFYGAFGVWLSRVVAGHPWKVLVLLAGELVIAGYWAHQLKNEKGMAAVVSKASNSVLRDFPDSAEKIRDVMVFWCKVPGCDLTKMHEFQIERKAVQGLLDTLRARHRHCQDLAWSSIDSTGPGSLLTALKFPYLSADKTTSFVEYQSTRRECMRDLRRQLQRGFHKSTGPLLMSLGGPESVAGASMDAELKSMMKHAYIAVPVSCLLLWLFVGNMFRVFTPVVCMVASYLSGQAVVGAVKHYVSPGLNVQYDDSFVLFIDLALCIDYALFFWTRFIVERASSTYEAALRQTLETSGAVIAVSNFFVVVAWTCTLCFPNLNLWGFQALYLEALSGCALAGAWSLAFTAAVAAVWPRGFDSGPSSLATVHEAIWQSCPKPEHFWKPWAKRITSRPLMFVLPFLAYACMIPFFVALTRYQPSFDVQKQGVRRDTLEHEALSQFEHNFRLGILSPVTLVVEASEFPPKGKGGRPSGDAAQTSAVLEKALPQPLQDSPQLSPLPPMAAGLAPGLARLQAMGGGGETPNTWMTSTEDVPLQSLADQLGPEGQALLGQLAAGGVEAQTGDVASMMQVVVFTRTPRTRSWRESNENATKLKAASKSVARAAGKAIRKLALNPEFGQLVCTIAEAIMNKTRGRQYEIQMADMLSIWWLPPQAGKTGCSAGTAKMVMHSQGLNLEKGLNLDKASMQGMNLEKAVVDFFPPVLQKSISKDGKKVQLKLFTRFSPSSPEAVDFDDLLRKQVEGEVLSNGGKGPKLFDIGGRKYALKVRHTSAIARQVEANREMAMAAPKIFGIFVVLTAGLITVTFRSAFLCMKLVLTVLCPIAATYGVTVAVYQLDYLGFLNAEIFRATGGLDFRMIYVTPGVLFGLAMDYDLFLFARVYEHRQEGYDNTSAVRKALEETGPVITAAGVLMAISFFAIMLSNTILFRTLGFVFFFGVTFDVFVIRTCIAPVFLCVAEWLNYWPRVMPKATKSWD